MSDRRGGGRGAAERVRLFVALELPDHVREALGSWGERVVGGASGIRQLADESLHATLCFLGWQPLQDLEAIAEACSVVAAEPRAELGIGAAIWLPRRMPSVLAVELEDRSGALARAQAALSRALQAGAWLRSEERPYLAHVTVARVARGAKPSRAMLEPAPALGFRAERVTLYRSLLERSGARYEALRRVELARGRTA